MPQANGLSDPPRVPRRRFNTPRSALASNQGEPGERPSFQYNSVDLHWLCCISTSQARWPGLTIANGWRVSGQDPCWLASLSNVLCSLIKPGQAVIFHEVCSLVPIPVRSSHPSHCQRPAGHHRDAHIVGQVLPLHLAVLWRVSSTAGIDLRDRHATLLGIQETVNEIKLFSTTTPAHDSTGQASPFEASPTHATTVGNDETNDYFV